MKKTHPRQNLNLNTEDALFTLWIASLGHLFLERVKLQGTTSLGNFVLFGATVRGNVLPAGPLLHQTF